ncbi:MAG TPA: hypothetical protein VK927_07850, partial [Adhaeribacter sp.]|nr:hypothetical protein [Adhaeribacter sp.]
SNDNIPESDLIDQHINKGLIKFSSPQVRVRGQKIKAMCYMIEQAGSMQAAAAGEDVPDNIMALFKGHEEILARIPEVVKKSLEEAGAKGVQIDKFTSQ